MQQYPISLKVIVDRSQLESLRSGLGLGDARPANGSWANVYAAAGKDAFGKVPD